jgi:hypothetical protein
MSPSLPRAALTSSVAPTRFSGESEPERCAPGSATCSVRVLREQPAQRREARNDPSIAGELRAAAAGLLGGGWAAPASAAVAARTINRIRGR